MSILVVDLVLVAILVVGLIIGLRRGFISMLIGFLGFAISFVAALLLSRVVGEWMFNTLFRESLISSVAQKISEAAGAGNIAAALETGLLGTLLKGTELSVFLGDLATNGATSVSTSIVDSVLASSIIALISIILFIIIFIIVMIIVRMLKKLFKSANKIPVLGPVNRLFGGVVGIAGAILVCIVAASFLSLFLEGETSGGLGIYRVISNYNPFYLVL